MSVGVEDEICEMGWRVWWWTSTRGQVVWEVRAEDESVMSQLTAGLVWMLELGGDRWAISERNRSPVSGVWWVQGLTDRRGLERLRRMKMIYGDSH